MLAIKFTFLATIPVCVKLKSATYAYTSEQIPDSSNEPPNANMFPCITASSLIDKLLPAINKSP